jgi:hypothetical protein
LEKVYALKKATLGPNHTDTLFTMLNCARAYQRAGKLDEADRLLSDLLARRSKRKDSIGEVQTARVLEFLSINALLQDRNTEAEERARASLALYEKNENTLCDDDDLRRFYVMNLLGGILLAQKQYAEAEPPLLQGYEGMKQREWVITAPWRYRLTEAGERVVRYYEETNQPEQARAWQERIKRDRPSPISVGIK